MHPRTIMAIDPGNRESAFVLIDLAADLRPVTYGKVLNEHLRQTLKEAEFDLAVIEQIGHYGTGMPAGRDVFDTCRWIGRYEQTILDLGVTPRLALRPTIKTHLCGTPRAKDGNVAQALIDRFTPGQPNRGKGTKANPGWFYGFHADIWQAYAAGVYLADLINPRF